MIAFEYVIPVILLFVATLYQGITIKPHVSKPFYVFCTLIIISIAGFRYAVGPDWPGYYNGYTLLVEGKAMSFQDTLNALRFEYAFTLVYYVFSNLDMPYWTFNLLFAGTSIYLKSSTIYKYCNYAYLGLLLYYLPLFFFEDIIQIRQGFATGIAVYASRYIVEKKIFPFLLAGVIAYNFHHSAIAFFPLAYFIGNLKNASNLLYFLCVLSILSSPIGISKYITPYISFLLPLEGATQGLGAYGSAEESGYGLADVVKIIYLVIIILFSKTTEKMNKTYIVFKNLYLFSLILYFFFKQEPILSIRLSGYYNFFYVILLPQILYSLRYSRHQYFALFSFTIVYIVVFFFHFSSLQNHWFKEYTNYIYYKKDPLSDSYD